MGMQEIRTALKVDLKKAPEHQPGLHVRSLIAPFYIGLALTHFAEQMASGW